jgi:hypothetical protein
MTYYNHIGQGPVGKNGGGGSYGGWNNQGANKEQNKGQQPQQGRNNGGGGGNHRQPWVDDRHPRIVAMMADYIAAQGLWVQLNEILNASNKRITNLPMIPECVNNGRPFVCWAHILVRCRFPNCKFKNRYVPCSSIPNAFAEEVVTILTPGVKHCARTQEQEGLPGKQQRADPQNCHSAEILAKKARTGMGNKYRTTFGWGDTGSKLDSNKLHHNKKLR